MDGSAPAAPENRVVVPHANLKLKFDRMPWAKLCYICNKVRTEVSGMAITAHDDPMRVVDFVLLPQESSEAYTEFDDDALTKHLLEYEKAGIPAHQSSRIWIHTHPGASAAPSGTDDRTFDRFDHFPWHIMFIMGRKETWWKDAPEVTCRLRTRSVDTSHPNGPIFITDREIGVTYKEPVAPDEHGRFNFDYDMDAWDEEVKEMVRTKTRVIAPLYTGKHSYNNFFGQESVNDEEILKRRAELIDKLVANPPVKDSFGNKFHIRRSPDGMWLRQLEVYRHPTTGRTIPFDFEEKKGSTYCSPTAWLVNQGAADIVATGSDMHHIIKALRIDKAKFNWNPDTLTDLNFVSRLETVQEEIKRRIANIRCGGVFTSDKRPIYHLFPHPSMASSVLSYDEKPSPVMTGLIAEMINGEKYIYETLLIDLDVYDNVMELDRIRARTEWGLDQAEINDIANAEAKGDWGKAYELVDRAFMDVLGESWLEDEDEEEEEDFLHDDPLAVNVVDTDPPVIPIEIPEKKETDDDDAHFNMFC